MIEHVLDAAERLAGRAHVTPVVTSATLDEQLGAEIFFKCENFQKIGAFKYRGAYNAISRLNDDERRRGVIAYSSGNHAQAVARVGSELGVATVIVMPDDAPEIKRRATAGYGAEIVLYDPATQIREEVAQGLLDEHGYTLIPPFDHPHVIAGQGTTTLEFLDQVELDTVLTPCGGGGLLTGSAVAAGHKAPHCRVIGVESVLADDATRSFHTGELQRVENPRTIADGTRTASMGKWTFPLMLDHVADMVTV
ncbi:MAG: pyridoxal-phosphate dependent enzyme, partial [Acidobacteriota bacterium]